MRRFDEPIWVRGGLTATEPEPREPMQFLWRGQLWSVRQVCERWRETGAWWTSPRVRAARGEAVPDGDDRDLLDEADVWRVVASAGLYGRTGVYELAQSHATGSWTLRAVVD